MKRLVLLGLLACNNSVAEDSDPSTCLVYVEPAIDREDPQVKELMNQILEATRQLELRKVNVQCGELEIKRP